MQTTIFILILLTCFTNMTLDHQDALIKENTNRPLMICHDKDDYSTGAYS